MKKKFIRQDSSRYAKIGKNRKKLQKWRKPRGRHSKIRKKRKSYPGYPTIGHRTSRKDSGKIKNLSPVLINNLKDLDSVKKGSIIIISSRIGAKKKIEILKKAEETKTPILNVRSLK